MTCQFKTAAHTFCQAKPSQAKPSQANNNFRLAATGGQAAAFPFCFKTPLNPMPVFAGIGFFYAFCFVSVLAG